MEQTSYQRLRGQADTDAVVIAKMVGLTTAYEMAKGNEDHPAVKKAKLALIECLRERDRDVSSAVEKALAPLGVRKASLWVDMEGAENTATFRVATGSMQMQPEPERIDKATAEKGVEAAITDALKRR